MRLVNYIWQHPAWPVFSFDRDALTKLNASYMTATKYMNLTHCAKATATRDLTDLTDKRCLEVFGSGRSVRYGLAL